MSFILEFHKEKHVNYAESKTNFFFSLISRLLNFGFLNFNRNFFIKEIIEFQKRTKKIKTYFKLN